MHSVHKVRPIAADGVASSVCLSVSVSHVCEPWKRLNPSRCRFRSWLIYVGPRNNVLYKAKIGKIHSQGWQFRGDNSAMRPFAKLIWTLAIITNVLIMVTLSQKRFKGTLRWLESCIILTDTVTDTVQYVLPACPLQLATVRADVIDQEFVPCSFRIGNNAYFSRNHLFKTQNC